MLLLVQLALAIALVAAALAIVVLWLLLLAFSYGGESGLMPWVGAGIVLYGLWVVALAIVVGAAGIFWLSRLAPYVSPKWRKSAAGFRWVATVTLGIGFVAAVGALAAEKLHPKDPFDGCVSYRDAAASAAVAASGAKPEVDCPVRK